MVANLNSFIQSHFLLPPVSFPCLKRGVSSDGSIHLGLLARFLLFAKESCWRRDRPGSWASLPVIQSSPTVVRDSRVYTLENDSVSTASREP